MKNRIYLIVLALAALVITSCAKEDRMTGEEISAISFEAWMAAHAPDAKRQASGIYVEKLQDSTDPNADTPAPGMGNWVMINFTGQALGSGNVFVTRYRDVAEQQGTFTYFTHYTPQFAEFSTTSSILVEGQYLALAGMKEGEKWKIYIPTSLAWKGDGATFSSGYEGQYGLPAYSPVIMELELVEVVPDPSAHEITLVRKFATEKWGQDFRNDTIAENMYLRQISLTGTGSPVDAESSASVFYVARFLDGFVADTNIDSVARENNIYITPTSSNGVSYEALDVTFANSENIDGFDKALKAMHYGEHAEVVFTSAYGYGALGNSNGNTIIQPYTPLHYELFVSPIGGAGTRMFPYIPSVLRDEDNFPLTTDKQGQWVRGFIVGAGNPDMNNTQFNGNFVTRTNILLGDTADESVHNNVIPVELPDGSEIQRVWNLVDNPSMHQVEVVVYGHLVETLGTLGIQNVTSYRVK